MSIKGIRMRFADFLTLLSIFEGTVHMNGCVAFGFFNSKFEFRRAMSFACLERSVGRCLLEE